MPFRIGKPARMVIQGAKPNENYRRTYSSVGIGIGGLSCRYYTGLVFAHSSVRRTKGLLSFEQHRNLAYLRSDTGGSIGWIVFIADARVRAEKRSGLELMCSSGNSCR